MKRLYSAFVLLFSILLLYQVPPVRGAVGDIWAVAGAGNADLWRITSSGLLTSSGSGMLNVQRYQTQTVAANTTLTVTSPEHILCTNISATLVLPDAALCPGKPFVVKAHTASDGNVTLDGHLSQTIDGAATYPVAERRVARILSDGSNWAVISGPNQ